MCPKCFRPSTAQSSGNGVKQTKEAESIISFVELAAIWEIMAAAMAFAEIDDNNVIP